MAGGIELATAYVSLIPSLRGVGKETESQLNDKMGKAGDDAGGSFAQRFAKAAAAALKIASAAAAAAMVAVAKASLDEYANYEQLAGGIETLYGDAASTVMANAEQAFSSAGLSANAYMETVTSTSAALINSLGGDTEKAAQMADMAIRDMADNANKMGTDIGSIQDAYSSFARGQFQLLDNLRLGYGGTKSEMERLLADAEAISGVHYDISSYADIVSAINVIQTEMGITGTTAKEASETISGSIAATQAAWTNLLTHLGDENADFSTLFDNLAESAGNAVRNIGSRLVVIFTQMWDNLPSFASRFGEFLAPMVPAVLAVMPQLVTSFSNMILGLVDQLPAALPQLMMGAAQLFQGLVLALLQVAPQLVLGLADTLRILITDLLNNAPQMFTTALEMFNQIWQAVLAAAPQIVTGLANIVAQLIVSLAAAAPNLFSAAANFIRGLPQAIGNAVGQAISAMGEMLNGVLNAVTGFDLGSAGVQLMQGLINGIGSMAGAVWDAVTGAVSGAIDGALNLLGIASPSKVFREIGEFTMQGFAIGIEKTANQARAAMLDATSGVIGAAEMSLSTSTEIGAASAGVVYNVVFDGTRVNDTEAIRSEVDSFVLDMVRRADQ